MVNGKMYEEYIDTDIRGNESRQWMSSELANISTEVLVDEYQQMVAQEAIENAKRIEAEAAHEAIVDEVMFAIRDMRDAGNATMESVKVAMSGFEAESYFSELALSIAENNAAKFTRELNNF
jgi:hypothetical protein